MNSNPIRQVPVEDVPSTGSHKRQKGTSKQLGPFTKLERRVIVELEKGTCWVGWTPERFAKCVYQKGEEEPWWGFRYWSSDDCRYQAWLFLHQKVE